MSSSVSPLAKLDVPAEKLSASADRRFSASSNDERVRVEGSTKKLTTVLPRSVGTFLISRRPISARLSAVSRIRPISSGLSAVDPQQVVAAEPHHASPDRRATGPGGPTSSTSS